MSSQRFVHGISVDDFIRHIRNGIELLKDLSSSEYDDILDCTEVLLFRQALKGDKISHNALYLVNPEKSERVHTALETYDAALNTFEYSACPELIGSISAEVTESTVRRLFFALLGIRCFEEAFAFLEHMWQYFSWSLPQGNIPASAFTTVFSVLMAGENRDDAYRLLKDTEPYIDWNDVYQQKTTAESAMRIFSVFLSLSKYALAKRVIMAIEPHLDFQTFLADLEAHARTGEDILLNERGEKTETEDQDSEAEEQEQEKQEKQEQQEQEDPHSILPILSTLVPIPPPVKASEKDQMAARSNLCPTHPDFPYNYSMPVWNTPDSPIGTITMLNENLYEILVTIQKHDGVQCLHDIPLSIKGFQAKFPRYSDEKYEKKIARIITKIERTLENPRNYTKKEYPKSPFELRGLNGTQKIQART
jgi:hypothetical protein